jgi:hypothetical protein
MVDDRKAGRIKCTVRFRSLSTAFGLIVMAVCASTSQTPSAGESGMEGVITISPANPGPARIDAAASIPLANATFAVEKNNDVVTSFVTDDQGRFRVSLQPGHYKISMKGKKSSIGRFGPFEADVAPGKMTNVQWECDSGIR